VLTIDGTQGEGGGQVLRSALGLSLVTGTPFRIERIRGRRRRPGLMRQHLTAVQAAAEVGGAEVDGAKLGSLALSFRPRGARAGDYVFRIGSSGSTTLVLQTVLPALLTAGAASSVRLEGGTHNPLAPTFEFLARGYAPLVERMGARLDLSLERHGFHPVGGGIVTARIEPARRLAPLDVLERGAIRRREATASVARLPESIARRELDVLRRRLGWEAGSFRIQQVEDSAGPGNVVSIEIESRAVTEVISSFGARGVPAEAVAERAAAEAERYLAAGAPVGLHLQDQLLLLLALAGGGSYRTIEPTPHTVTHAEVIRSFLAVRVERREVGAGLWEIAVR
jgi:RNA 3'-terminal phosphate cyclase (ATP)